MAAQYSRGLLGCFVLVCYPESQEDLTQAGHPPAAGACLGLGAAGEQDREVCAGSSGRQPPASYRHLLKVQKKGREGMD